MSWIEQVLSQFCQDLGVSVPSPLGHLIQLDFEQGAILQLERHGQALTLWLALDLPWHHVYPAARHVLSRTYSRTGPPLPLRCGWAGESRLLLFITLSEWRVTLPVLHEALATLMSVRNEVVNL